jgi:hypothetical protein
VNVPSFIICPHCLAQLVLDVAKLVYECPTAGCPYTLSGEELYDMTGVGAS